MIARMPELSFSETSARLKAEQRIDFVLREDALGAALGGLDEMAVVDHRRPLRRHRFGRQPLPESRGSSRSALRPAAVCSASERHAPLGGERVVVDLILGCHFRLNSRGQTVTG